MLRLGLRLGFVSVKMKVEVRLGAGGLSFVPLVLPYIHTTIREDFSCGTFQAPCSEDFAWIFMGELEDFSCLAFSFQFYHAFTRL